MRSVNVTYKIYEFSELLEDAKTKVNKWYLENFYSVLTVPILLIGLEK